MIPGFDFTSVIAAFGYPAAPVEVADVPGIYENAQWSYDWEAKETRRVHGIMLMPESQNNTVDQSGSFENGVANLTVLSNIPMYAPGILEFEHPGGGDWQSFFRLRNRWYKVMSFEFIWENTNCRSYTGFMYSRFGVTYEAKYQ